MRRIGLLLIGAAAGVLLLCDAGWGQAVDRRAPLPDAAKVKEALGLIREVFADEYAAAKTAEQTTALAKKILNEGITGQHDPASRYALFRVARDIATLSGDAEAALAAIDALGKRFQIESISMKAVALAKIADKIHLPAEHEKFLSLLDSPIDEAITASRYDLARGLCKLAAASAAKTRDPKAKIAVGNKLRELTRIEADYAKIKDALAVIEKTPADPDANLAVGKFRCFILGDWAGGLPNLALGGDETLRSLAERELVAPSSAADQDKLADAWWDVAEQETGAAKTRLRQRAGRWYRKALPSLSGIAKIKASRRLEQVGPIEQTSDVADTKPAQRPSGAANRTPVDLLAAIDVKRDAVKGIWSKDRAGMLVSPALIYARLRLPVLPPEEYVLSMVVTRLEGIDSLNVGFVAGGRQCLLIIDGLRGSASGFSQVDRKRFMHNTTLRQGRFLPAGTTNHVAVTVRKTGVLVTCNNRPIIHWREDIRRLSPEPGWDVGDNRALFIGDWGTSFLFRSITLTPLSGSGKRN